MPFFSFLFLLWIAPGLCLNLSAPLTAFVHDAVNLTWTADPQDPFRHFMLVWGQHRGRSEGSANVKVDSNSGQVSIAFNDVGQYFVGAFNSSGRNRNGSRRQGNNGQEGDLITHIFMNVTSRETVPSTTPLFPSSTVAPAESSSLSPSATYSMQMETYAPGSVDFSKPPVIIGIVLGAAALFLILLILFIVFRYRRRRRRPVLQPPPTPPTNISGPIWLQNMELNHPNSVRPESTRPVTISTAPDLEYAETVSSQYSVQPRPASTAPNLEYTESVSSQYSAQPRPVTISTAPDLDYAETISSGRETVTFWPYVTVPRPGGPRLPRILESQPEPSGSALVPYSGRTASMGTQTEEIVSPAVLTPGSTHLLVTTPHLQLIYIPPARSSL